MPFFDRNTLYVYGGTYAIGMIAVVASLLYTRTREAIPYLPVPAFLQTCEVSSECMPVETRCDKCCGYEAIAVAHLNAYIDMYRESCAPYALHAYREDMNRDAFALDHSSGCDCFEKDTMPACIHGTCQLSESPDTAF
jgi:hypothetical protein